MARKWKPEHKEKARREGLALISITIDARLVPKGVRRNTVIGSAQEVGIEGAFELPDVESLWTWFLNVTRPAKAEHEGVSVFEDESGWRWKFYSKGLRRNIYSKKPYTSRQGALRAGQRMYRRAYGPSIDEMLEKERKGQPS